MLHGIGFSPLDCLQGGGTSKIGNASHLISGAKNGTKQLITGQKEIFDMYLHLGRPESIEKLGRVRDSLDLSVVAPTIAICVIDDEPFPYLEIIRSHNFRVREYRDIEDINVVREYEIVLCDIKGVGKSFGSKYEGAHVISLIRSRFPDKVIIAYTGHQHDANYNQYLVKSDFVMKKDSDSTEWIETLDEAVKRTLDPIEKWKRVRADLLERRVPIFDVAMLEHQYSARMLTGAGEFPTKKLLDRLPQDARGVLTSLVASAIFEVIAG